jgi:hypothetical protein
MLFDCLLFVVIVAIALAQSQSNMTCVAERVRFLSQCSFRSIPPSNDSTVEWPTLSMIVPYPLNPSEEDDLLVSMITHPRSSRPLIRLNLNLIECANAPPALTWTSLAFSSTLTGEFVRSNAIDKNLMYLPAGVTYLKNFSTIDCSSKTAYRTDDRLVFQLDLRFESTLNDTCFNDEMCYPREAYHCHAQRRRCSCREPFQSYRLQDRYPVCIHAVPSLDQCATSHVRCFEWCHSNASTDLCLCPDLLAEKKYSADHRGKSVE